MDKINADWSPKFRLRFPSKKKLTNQIKGSYRSIFKGYGTEFDSYREYQPDDDASMIDWKASARSNNILIREYVEKRQLLVVFMVDVSNSMVFGSTEKLKNEYATEIIAALAYEILRNSDAVELFTFNDKINNVVPANNQIGQFASLGNVLLNTKTYGGKYNLGEPLRKITNRVKKNSTLIIISDFIGFKESDEKRIKGAAAKLDVIAIAVRDPRDKALPKTSQQVLISDPFTGKQILVNPDKIRKEYKEHTKTKEKKIRRILIDSGCDYIELTTDKPFLTELIKFFTWRQKKWI